MESDRGVFELLFDFGFSEFITKRLMKYVYAWGIVGSLVALVLFILSSAGQGSTIGCVTAVLAVLVFVVWVIWLRISLEMVLVIFRIEENTRSLREDYRGRGQDAGPDVASREI